MANLNDLDLSPEEIDAVDVENVPTFASSFNPVPQPGTYLFKMPPPEVLFNCFKILETADQGQRLQAVFREESALWNQTLGEFYDAQVSNRVRYVTRKNRETGEDEQVAISDMAQLLNVLGSIPEAKNNTGYGRALVAAGGRFFKAEHTLTANCNKDRDIYKDGTVIKGKKGCGQRYAQEAYQPKTGKPVFAIPQTEGKFALRFSCTCGAELRCWGQLRGFRKAATDKPATE